MKNILISGGTGLVGKTLIPLLQKNGYNVAVLTRQIKHKDKSIKYFSWNPNKRKIDTECFKWADAIINLAGENVAKKKWTQKQKTRIQNSRIDAGKTLSYYLTETPHKVKHFIQASAIGWYGDGNYHFKENAPPAKDFLGQTCQLWEDSIALLQNKSIPVTIVRIGIVLSPYGGFFKAFYNIAKNFPIIPLFGGGKQQVSWIHIEDLCYMFLYILQNKHEGIYNAVSPNPKTNKEFIQMLITQKFLRRRIVTLPSWILKVILGEMSIEILKSCTVSSEKIVQLGFVFSYPELAQAIQNILLQINGTSTKTYSTVTRAGE